MPDSIADHVWRTRYQWVEGGHTHEPDIAATWDRLALAVSGVEPHHRDIWRERFRWLLHDHKFLPGGRILANAGTPRHATLLNCFVAGDMEDSIHGIFNALRETMVTLQAGGGVGIDFSELRPMGSAAVASGSVASGPVSFMQVFEEASSVLETGNQRRGAMMAVLRCDHPDIEQFIDAKLAAGCLHHFNLSVAVTDAFMQALEEDAPWALVFPLSDQAVPIGTEVCERVWPGNSKPRLCKVHRRVSARALWSRLQAAAHASAEPGVLWLDRINRDNNLWYCENITATNPCGEVPLPAHGACNLGSINLAQLVQHPFGEHPHFDMAGLRALTCVAVRFLDNVIDATMFPLNTQEKIVRASRRVGLGITGLADMLFRLGLRYASPASLQLVHEIMRVMREVAYQTSIELAQEKGAFALWEKTHFAASPIVLNLPHAMQDAIARYGMRNSHLLAIAPAGSISLLANNVSSGIEPVFALQGQRMVRGADGQSVAFEVVNAAVAHYRQLHGKNAPLPACFVTVNELSAEEQLRMVAAVQPYVDGAVSKTVQLPADASVEAVGKVFELAWQWGLKGCTVWRSNLLGG